MTVKNWQPSASLEVLQARAEIIQHIRQFFAERGVLEVDTPQLCHSSGTDPNIESMPVSFKQFGESEAATCYLQTSPEFPMKRLLASGIGDIYQICKTFRNGEVGRHHNPEFLMLEWYRVGFDHHALMNEVDALLTAILHSPKAQRLTYREAFQLYLQIDPFESSLEDLQLCVKAHDLHTSFELSRDGWLQLLMSHFIEPQLGQEAPCFIYDFPASQASLAQINPHNPLVAERFEVYIQGIELANGFHELQNAQEQRARFMQDLQYREAQNQPLIPLDEHFLQALEAGLPDCSGVALGVDRLIMLALKKSSIQEILSFDFSRV